LKTHLQQKALENPKGKSYLVKVETHPNWGSTPYFLSLWVDSKALLEDIDIFLRDIWLECCDHMSEFRNPTKKQNDRDFFNLLATQNLSPEERMNKYLDFLEETDEEEDMEKKVGTVFQKDLKLQYDYDFGSTTELQLTIVEEYPVKADQKIVLLSRNEPLEWLCDSCNNEPATRICTAHDWDDDALFCDKCAKKHAKKCRDFLLPVVNSPEWAYAVTKEEILIRKEMFFLKVKGRK
jgi:hypothetical protein